MVTQHEIELLPSPEPGVSPRFTLGARRAIRQCNERPTPVSPIWQESTARIGTSYCSSMIWV